jgi:hypothetical protein
MSLLLGIDCLRLIVRFHRHSKLILLWAIVDLILE